MPQTKQEGRYLNKNAILATKHRKADALRLPLKAGLGIKLRAYEIDTDKFGTFTGEIERQGSPIEAAVRKARLAMSKSGEKLAFASEGSFGPHPLVPYMAFSQEFLVLLDEELGIQVSESVLSTNTNFCHVEVHSIEEAEDFLRRAKFPSHALIVRPANFDTSFLDSVRRIVAGKRVAEPIYKGIHDREALASAILACRKVSIDGSVRIETDMRANMNPSRMRVLRALGIKLARRLRCTCPECGCPGFGMTGKEGVLPCEECGFPSDAHANEIHSCPRCGYSEAFPREDGFTSIEALFCQRCNP